MRGNVKRAVHRETGPGEPPLTDHCEICNNTPSRGNPLLHLQELGAGDGTQDVRINLCRGCLGRREVMSWSTKRAIGEEIARALGEHPSTHGHYAYLAEPTRLHLVRLRSRWVAQHVASG